VSEAAAWLRLLRLNAKGRLDDGRHFDVDVISLYDVAPPVVKIQIR
jgi:hypothetical protein